MEARKEKKAYAAPAIEFQAIVTDIIMCPSCMGGGHDGGGGHGGGGR